ncbi:hypothetical protein L531_0847 [Bordetella bronchiseptica MO275]|nr:hypothetical protein L492_0888 [Bordetella bronchiseptica 7E71]KDD83101.1 hypothetical protein L531_0847 [Bordetella bronchiseptica MO275]
MSAGRRPAMTGIIPDFGPVPRAAPDFGASGPGAVPARPSARARMAGTA